MKCAQAPALDPALFPPPPRPARPDPPPGSHTPVQSPCPI